MLFVFIFTCNNKNENILILKQICTNTYALALVYNLRKDLLYILLSRYRLVCDFVLGIGHLPHLFQDKGQYICSSGMLCSKGNLNLQHIQVCMQHMDLQNIPEYIGRQQLCSFLSKWHLNHMGWGCMDLVALLLVVGLKKNV